MFSDRFLLFIPFLKFEKSHADTREQSILEKVEWLSIRSQKKKNRKSQFYSQRKIWKMARNHDLISLNMIGMTSALIAWLLPFWSKGKYHQTVMLETMLCCWLYDGDRFKILVTESICNILNVVTLFIILLIFNMLNRSPASQCCHQHISSSTFVANIDVALLKCYVTKLELVSLELVKFFDMIFEKSMTDQAQDIIFLVLFRLAGWMLITG